MQEIPSEIRDIYQIPTDAQIIADYTRAVSPSQGISKFFTAEYKYAWGLTFCMAILTESFIQYKQPQGDVARRIRFEKMHPLRRATLKGIPALALLGMIHCGRQFLIW